MSLRTILKAGLALGLLGVAGGAVCALLAGVHPLLDLGAMFAAPALTCAVIGLLAATALRGWRLAGGFAVTAAALLFALSPQWFPKTRPAAPDARPVTIYFSNVWAGNSDAEAVRASIAQARPDIVAMVEVNDDLAGAKDQILTDYPHRLSTPPARYFRGGPRVTVASRWPIAWSANARRDGLAVADVEAQTPFGPVRLVTAHLARPWPLDGRPGYQRDQARRLAARIRDGGGARVVLVGDFNATASSDVLRDFAREAGLTNAPARTGTWIHPLPGIFRIAIDNAFTGEHLTVVSRRTGRANGSDHLPVIVEVAPAEARQAP